MASASVPHSLVLSTVKFTNVVGKTGAVGAISANVAVLSEGVLKAMFLTKLKTVMAVLIMVGILGSGIGVTIIFHPIQALEPTVTQNAAKPKNERLSQDAPMTEPAKNDKNVQKQVDEPKENAVENQKPKIKSRIEKRSGVAFLMEVDVVKKTIRVIEFAPERSNEAIWNIVVDPTTKITINKKESQLADLQAVLQKRLAICLEMECEFEVIDEQKLSLASDRWKKFGDKGKAIRIEATGNRFEGVVYALDFAKNTLTTGPFRTSTKSILVPLEVAKDALVIINGKSAQFSDVKPNMKVNLENKAGTQIVGWITISGPKVDSILKTIDEKKNTISVYIPKVQMTAERVLVAMDAKVVIDGAAGKLSDLKVGMPVVLQM